MLAIRLQRTGRRGHAQFRLIVQDSRFSPSGGRVVAYLGSYDPHTKAAAIDSQQAAKYLENGAQPSERAARLLKSEGIKLPAWVKLSEPKQRDVRNPEKRRSTTPAEPEAPLQENEAPAEADAEAPVAEETAAQEVEETAAEEAEETPATESTEEKPAE